MLMETKLETIYFSDMENYEFDTNNDQFWLFFKFSTFPLHVPHMLIETKLRLK